MHLKKNHKIILFSIISLAISYVISYLMLKGVGAPRSFFHTILLVFLITLCSSSKKGFRYFVLPFTIMYALYTPIGFTYGPLSYEFLIAGISTDLLETKEFFHQIPYVNYFIPLIIISGLLLYRYITNQYNIQFFKNRSFIIVAIIISLASQTPMSFVHSIQEGATNIYNEQKLLDSSLKESSWGISTLDGSLYDNYILIIGESARKDYHHAYGYPINNTPFMSTENGILIDGLTAGGTSTVPSLKAMLTLADTNTWDADYSKTIVGLAQSAGLKTYWLSNQGYLGTYDTPISAIAATSDHKYFLKYGDYSALNTSDFDLLSLFENIVKQAPNEKKLIIIHLYGSHPNACDRIQDYPLIHKVSDDYYSYLNCYITSIHKTDTLLKKIHDYMNLEVKKYNTSYSMLYFSDHGLAHREINQTLYFNNNQISQFHYDIPLFMTSSSYDEKKSCKSFKSALNFTTGLANWIGINNTQLNNSYSLFDCKDDTEDFGLKEKKQSGIFDKAINLEGK